MYILIIIISVFLGVVPPALIGHYNLNFENIYFATFLILEIIVVTLLIMKYIKTEKFFKVVRARILATILVCLFVSVTGLPLFIDKHFRPEMTVADKCLTKFNCGECTDDKCICDFCASDPSITSGALCEEVEEIKCPKDSK